MNWPLYAIVSEKQPTRYTVLCSFQLASYNWKWLPFLSWVTCCYALFKPWMLKLHTRLLFSLCVLTVLLVSVKYTYFTYLLIICVGLSVPLIHSRLGESVAGDSGKGSAQFWGCLDERFSFFFLGGGAKRSSLLKVFPHWQTHTLSFWGHSCNPKPLNSTFSHNS